MSVITSTSKRGAGPSNVTAQKLNSLADNFNNFYGDLEEETTVRKQAEEQRLARIEREMAKLEKTLNVETKRRIETSKAIQASFEEKLKEMQEKFRVELKDTTVHLQEQLDVLKDRLSSLEQAMIDEKEGREREIQRANAVILEHFSEHQKNFEMEKVTRLEREAQTLKRVGDEVFRLQQKISSERTSREAAVKVMKDDFDEATKAREKSDEMFKSEMLRKMASVQKDLEIETKAREQAEEQLVNALNDYTRALQDGLRIVNRAK